MNKDNDQLTENISQEQTNSSNAELHGNRPYQAPTLTRFGSLVDLVQSRSGVGRDGGVGSDCTLS